MRDIPIIYIEESDSDSEDELHVVYDQFPRDYVDLPQDFFDRETPPNTPKRNAQKPEVRIEIFTEEMDFLEDNKYDHHRKTRILQNCSEKLLAELNLPPDEHVTNYLYTDKGKSKEINHIRIQCESDLQEIQQQKENMLPSSEDSKMNNFYIQQKENVSGLKHVSNNVAHSTKKSTKMETLSKSNSGTSEITKGNKNQILHENCTTNENRNENVSKSNVIQNLSHGETSGFPENICQYHEQNDVSKTCEKVSSGNESCNTYVNDSQQVKRKNSSPEISKKVKMTRCELCGKLVLYLADHILNDHQDLFTC